MLIYRVMNLEEFDETMKYKSFSFLKRFKWFSVDIIWIRNRVRDGRFNNSNFKKDRYKHLLYFDIDDNELQYFTKVGHHELMLDRRRSHNVGIKFIKELKNERI